MYHRQIPTDKKIRILRTFENLKKLQENVGKKLKTSSIPNTKQAKDKYLKHSGEILCTVDQYFIGSSSNLSEYLVICLATLQLNCSLLIIVVCFQIEVERCYCKLNTRGVFLIPFCYRFVMCMPQLCQLMLTKRQITGECLCTI